MKYKQLALYINISFIIILLFQFILNLSNIKFLEIEIFISYIIVVFFSKKIYKKWEHPFVMILGTFFLFCLSRVFLSLFYLWDLSISDKFRYYKFEKQVIIETLNCLLIFINFYFLGGILYSYRQNKEYKINLKEDKISKKIGKHFFIYGFIGSFSSKIKEFFYIREHGYLSIYTGELQKIPRNYFERLGITFLILGYVLVVFGKISEKNLKYILYSF